MSLPTKKLKSGFELPVYGMGLWRYSYLQGIDTAEDEPEIAAIQDAIAKGVTHFDTAEKYGDGHSEETLGKAMKGFDRSKVFIATKVRAEKQGYDDLHRSFEASIQRLGTDYIDLYLLHSYPAPGISITDTMRALDDLVRQGVVKNIGVCNMTPNRFSDTQKHTKNKMVCNQVHYNVQFREIEDKGVLKYCQDNDVMVVAWRPMQYGKLHASILDELAQKYDKTPLQIALNWVISQDHVVAISKTTKPEHLQENLGAIGWTMDSAEIERIRKDFPDQKLVSDAVPLGYEADIEP